MNFLRRSFFIVGLLLAVASLSQSLNAVVYVNFTTTDMSHTFLIEVTPDITIEELKLYLPFRINLDLDQLFRDKSMKNHIQITKIVNLFFGDRNLQDTERLVVPDVDLSSEPDLLHLPEFHFTAVYEEVAQ